MKTFSKLFWWVACFWFFALAGFLFFDLFGIRRIVQYGSTVILIVMGGILLWQRPRLSWLDSFSFFYLTFLLYGLCCSLVLRGAGNELFNLGGALFFLIFLHLAPSESRSSAVRSIILVTTYFAVTGVFQYLLALVFPTLGHASMVYGYQYEDSSNPVLSHWIQLFGISNEEGTKSGGIAYRARSYMYEPSLVVAYFLAPAALAFRGEKNFRYCGWLCLLFVVCSFSGSAILAIAMGLIAYLFSHLKFGRIPFLMAMSLPLLIVLTLLASGNEKVLDLLNEPGRLLGISFLQKNYMDNVRIFGNIDALSSIFLNPMGTAKLLTLPIGSLIGAAYLYGIIGGILNAIVVWLGLKTVFDKFRLKISNWTLSSILGIGSFFSAFVFAWHGYNSAYGMTLLYLIGSGATPDRHKFRHRE